MEPENPPDFCFVVPDPGDVVSGGHLYNARMMSALREAGAVVERVDLGDAAAAMTARPGAVFVFDSLHLGDVAALPMEERNTAFLAHHLPSLEPGTRSADEVFDAHERAPLQRFARLWTTSTFAADYLRQRGLDTDRVFTIEPACDELPVVSAELHDPPQLLLTANLIERKGVLPFLEELGGRAVLPPFALRIVGGDMEPEYAARCRAYAAEHLADCVTFAGQVEATAMADEYDAADLLLSVATMETFGMAIREAITAGVPVLLLDRGFGRRHFEVGGAGQPFETLNGLTDALFELLREPTRLAVLKRAAIELRPPPRTWATATAELLAAWK